MVILTSHYSSSYLRNTTECTFILCGYVLYSKEFTNVNVLNKGMKFASMSSDPSHSYMKSITKCDWIYKNRSKLHIW